MKNTAVGKIVEKVLNEHKKEIDSWSSQVQSVYWDVDVYGRDYCVIERVSANYRSSKLVVKVIKEGTIEGYELSYSPERNEFKYYQFPGKASFYLTLLVHIPEELEEEMHLEEEEKGLKILEEGKFEERLRIMTKPFPEAINSMYNKGIHLPKKQ